MVGRTMDKGKGFGRVIQWLRDARAELRRVIWPTFKEARILTLVVIALSAAVGAVLFVFDWTFNTLYQLLFAAVSR